MCPTNAGNPMADLLRQEIGIDAFALDGDDREVAEPWTSKSRREARPLVSVRPR